MEGVGRREAVKAANDFIPVQGGDTGALAVEQLKCVSASRQWPCFRVRTCCRAVEGLGG